MNKRMKAYGWEFYYDKDVTENYYKNYNDLCQCSSCRNFYKNVELIPEDVRMFMEQFGIDISKPIEQESIVANK